MCFTLCVLFCFFFFKQKTAYEMRISDWSSDVCSSDLSDGVFIGRIDTVAFSNVVALRPVISQNDAAPKYEVMALTPARTWAKVGEIGRASCRERGCQYV